MTLVKFNKYVPSMWPSFFDEEELFNWPQISNSNDSLNIYETDDSVVVEASVPGIPKENVEVTIEGNVLTIKAHFEQNEEEKKKKKVVYKNSRKTSFAYSTSLPRAVEANKASAEVENGVIKVTIPKMEEEKPKRIEVKTKG